MPIGLHTRPTLSYTPEGARSSAIPGYILSSLVCFRNQRFGCRVQIQQCAFKSCMEGSSTQQAQFHGFPKLKEIVGSVYLHNVPLDSPLSMCPGAHVVRGWLLLLWELSRWNFGFGKDILLPKRRVHPCFTYFWVPQSWFLLFLSFSLRGELLEMIWQLVVLMRERERVLQN